MAYESNADIKFALEDVASSFFCTSSDLRTGEAAELTKFNLVVLLRDLLLFDVRMFLSFSLFCICWKYERSFSD